MEQRRLRLGDILDDYCPRERRVTNHAVVAMVEEDVKQTRCSTCDAEHVYKGGKAPRQRKLEGSGKLYKQVLAGLTDPDPVISAATVDGDMMDESDPDSRHANDAVESTADGAPVVPVADAPLEQPRDGAVGLAADEPDDSDDQPQPSFDDGPVHRPLIRAQLPRIEGVKLERQAPDFTIRQNNGRGSNFRGAHGHGGGTNTGQRFGRGPFRDRGGSGGGSSSGGGRGASQGFGRGPGGHGGNGQPRQGGGGGPRKRGR